MITIVLSALILYAIQFIPQMRLFDKPDQHLGNMTAWRVCGFSLPEILFSHNSGMPIPTLIAGLQYDRFKGDIRKYRLTHAILTSLLAPLLFCFSLQLTGDLTVSVLAGLLYALLWHAPITLNVLFQPEHFELLFSLSGGIILLHGADSGSYTTTVAGAAILGASQLCKPPGLLSLWMIGLLVVRNVSDVSATHLAAAYLSPFALFVVSRQLYNLGRGQKKMKGTSKGGLRALLGNVIDLYFYHIKKNPKEYVKTAFLQQWSRYVCQLLPVVYLALSFFFGPVPGETKEMLGYGLLFVSLIFIVRMCGWLTYSLNVFLAIAAGFGLATILRDISFLPLLHLVGTVAAAAVAIKDDPWHVYVFKKPTGEKNPVVVAAEKVRSLTAPADHIFLNVNNTFSHFYMIAERGFPHHFSPLLMGAYNPKLDPQNVPAVVASEGEKIVRIIGNTPPLYIVEHLETAPLVNLHYIQKLLPVRYQLVEILYPFVFFRLTYHEPADKQPEVDPQLLFDQGTGQRITVRITNQAIADYKRAHGEA